MGLPAGGGEPWETINRGAGMRLGMSEQEHPILARLRAQQAGQVPEPPIQQFLGFKIVEVAEGKVILEGRVDQRHHNPMGTVHGGILTAYTDSAMGIAFSTLLVRGESMTTVEVKTNFIRPLVSETITVRARVTYKGKTVGLVESGVRDEEFRLVAKSTGTFLVLRGDKARGREIDFERPDEGPGNPGNKPGDQPVEDPVDA